MHLKDKVAIVTGSGRGIGRGVAMFLAENGAKVVINDPGSAADGSGEDSAPAQKTADDIIANGGKAVANFDSVADYKSAGQLVDQAIKEWGQVDILVNCAGILRDRMVFNMSKEEWDAVIQVHLDGHFNMISHVSKIMRKNQSGRIINFTSNSGLLGNIGQVNYGAAKAGIAGMTRSIAKDLEKYNITVNAISPVADTRMTADVESNNKSKKKQSIFAGMKEPEFVAPMIGYLASDNAKNINGKIFYVQGGRVSLPFHPSPEHSIVSEKKIWNLQDLDDGMHYVLLRRKRNPVPPLEEIEIPGRDKPATDLLNEPLKNKTIIVTGAAGGIGNKISETLASYGANLILNDPGSNLDGSGNNQNILNELASKLEKNNPNILMSEHKITEWEDSEELIKTAVSNFGTIDAVVHVAGILQDRMIFNMTEEEWNNVIKVHLTAYFNLAKHASAIMRKQNFGRLIGFTSSSGLIGNAGQANYSAAKAGIAGMTRCLAIDLGRNGITANAIAPTAMTRMTDSVPEQIQEDKFNEEQKSQRAELDPAQIAPLTAYLCSEQAWDINGKIFYSAGKKISIAHDVLPFRSINKPSAWNIDDLSVMVPDLLNGISPSA